MIKTHDRNQAISLGRNQVKEEILDIIKKHIRPSYHEESGGRVGFDVQEIPWQETKKMIKEIEDLN